MFISSNKNAIFVKKKKQYIDTTGYRLVGNGPSICMLADKNRIYTPNHDEIESNFKNEGDILISYQIHHNDDNTDYDSHRTRENNGFVYNYYDLDENNHFSWRSVENKQIINIVDNNGAPEFENITLSEGETRYLNYRFGSVYETYCNPNIIRTNSMPYVSTSSGISCTTTIEYSYNDYFPAQLGCAILFSATKLPSAQFAVGIKGGQGGNMYKFTGKLYNSNDTEHIRNLGNNLYLFYDTIIDNINFRTSLSSKFVDENNNEYLYFAPPVIVGDITLELVNGTVVASSYKGEFEDFHFVSTRTFVQFGQPNLDEALCILPTAAEVSPRYNTNSPKTFVKNNKLYFFHSKTPYDPSIPGYNKEYGYNGMTIYNATEIFNWGDVKYITEMNAACAFNHDLSAIPAYWGNWENLKTTEFMFGQDYALTGIPTSWNGLNNVTSTSSMFYNASSLQSIPTSWSGLENVLNAKQMFIFCNSIRDIPSSWEGLNNVSSTSDMFLSAGALTGIPQSWSGLDNLENATSMFNNCTALTNVNLSDLLTCAPNLKNISGMFWKTNINNVTGISAFIDACMNNTYLSATSAHLACFAETPAATAFNVADYPGWFNY